MRRADLDPDARLPPSHHWEAVGGVLGVNAGPFQYFGLNSEAELGNGLKILVCVKDLTFHISGWRPFQADYLAAGENGSVQDKLPLALEHLDK